MLSKARFDLLLAEQKKADFLYFKSTSKWINVGDRVTKEFIGCKGQKWNRTVIQGLKDSSGQLHTDAISIRNIATSYYESLLQADPISQRVEECRNQIWEEVKSVVSSQMNDKLSAQIIEGELKEAVWALPKNKCPGEDGLSVVFLTNIRM